MLLNYLIYLNIQKYADIILQKFNISFINLFLKDKRRDCTKKKKKIILHITVAYQVALQENVIFLSKIQNNKQDIFITYLNST